MSPACFLYTTPPEAANDSYLSFFLNKNTSYQLHVPVQLPCYDFVPVKNPPTQASNGRLHNRPTPSAHLKRALFQTVTGGLYRTPEPVHRNLADLRLLAIPSSRFFKLQKAIRTEKTFIYRRTAAP